MVLLLFIVCLPAVVAQVDFSVTSISVVPIMPGKTILPLTLLKERDSLPMIVSAIPYNGSI